MNVRLHIERLILDGVPMSPAGGRRMEAAATHELTRLLASGNFSSSVVSGGALAQLAAGPVQLDGGRDPVHVGRQIARAIYAGLKEPESR